MSRSYRFDSNYESMRPHSAWARREVRRARDARAERHVDEATFRCGHCKLMVGPVPSGGRQRNHCPTCLYSRHVDGKTPGDRASECGALMAPIGTFARPDGEQVVVHRCGGCGFVRACRVAADDNPLSLMRLPLLPPLELAAVRERRRA